jgi:hypothetical protein
MSLESKALARTKLAARQQRVALIRGWIAAFSALVFVVLWLVVGIQLALGRDPALSTKARRLQQAAAVRARELRRARRRAAVDLSSVHARRPAATHSLPSSPSPTSSSSENDGSDTSDGSSAGQSSTAPAPAPPSPAPTPIVTSQS